jgi:microcystin-dependent protein
MGTPFLGEVRVFSFDFVPKGWLVCAGQLLPINQNQALFSILGTTYGGDGRVTFALPDLRGRTAVGSGLDVALGEQGGQEAVTLSAPQAGHVLAADVEPTTNHPSGAVLARGGSYADQVDGSTGSVGGNQPHENRAPFLTLTFAIAAVGIFPSRN